MVEPHIRVRRYPYEEPDATRLEFMASNGRFAGVTDFFCNVSDLAEIGHHLKTFPSKLGDEYLYKISSTNAARSPHLAFALRAYMFDSVGHSALQITMSSRFGEPKEESCRFSIRADPGTINRLGKLFWSFADLQHLEMQWTPREGAIYEDYQPPYP